MARKIDLFKNPEKLPLAVVLVLKKYSEKEPEYKTVKRMKSDLNKLGYDFDFGLDAIPHNLKKIKTISMKTTKSKRKPATKKPAVSAKKAPAKRKKVVSARSICRKVISVPGINKRTGQLLPGYHYVNGKPVKAKSAPKKKPAKKRGLGVTDYGTPGDLCYLNQPGQPTVIYGSRGGAKPCPRGGRVVRRAITLSSAGQVAMNGAKAKKKAPTTAQKNARAKFKIDSAKARQLVDSKKAKNLASAWAMIKKKK